MIGITEKYFQVKELLANRDVVEDKKIFQSVRKKLKQMGFKDLPDLESLKIEMEELNNGIKLFQKYATGKNKKLSNLFIAKENLIIIKGHVEDVTENKEKEPKNNQQSHDQKKDSPSR